MISRRWTLGGSAAVVCCAVTPLIASAESESRTVQVSATILPRLELSVTPDTGSTIAFGAVTQPAPGETATHSVAVNLRVFSNLDRPYQVTHMIRRPLTNAAGNTIPDTQFLVATHAGARGELRAPTPAPIIPGIPATLYESNARGNSDTFVANYSLAVTPATPSGNFATEVVYTVTSL